jgi:hypothetical protein
MIYSVKFTFGINPTELYSTMSDGESVTFSGFCTWRRGLGREADSSRDVATRMLAAVGGGGLTQSN